MSIAQKNSSAAESLSTDSSTQSQKELSDHDPPSVTNDSRLRTYYHGLLPRGDIDPLLQKDGDFLVRKTEKDNDIVIVLSVRWRGQPRHFIVNQRENQEYYFENHAEKSIHDLVEWHRSTKEPLTATSGACIRHAVERSLWILNHDDVKMTRKLGEGAFGEVFKATFREDGKEVEVAVKTMREAVSREARLKFMKEARLMRKLSHKHVVKVLGVAVFEHLLIVMELCPGGSLLSYLRKNKAEITLDTKLRFIAESAAGMDYLEKANCIHRDLAARNVLLSEKGGSVKISDFGLSEIGPKEIQEDKLDKVPVKWLAPETMQHKVYSTKSDVWSYGIMAYEVYSNGEEPYPGLTNIQTRAKIIVQNYRMEMPKETPPDVVKLIAQCWAKDPNDRPCFAEVYETLKEMAATDSN